MLSELGYSIIALISFAFIATQASYVDIKERTVKNSSYVYLILIAFINKDFSITASIFGAVIVFIVLFVASMITNDLGGGDIKYCALCSFAISSITLSLISIFFACLITLIAVPIARKKKLLESKTIPMIPFFSFGFFVAYILKYLIDLE